MHNHLPYIYIYIRVKGRSEIQLLHVHVCSVVVQWPWLHACVKSIIPASYTFCRTVAERFRQQWHDLALSHGLGTRFVASTWCKPGSGDETRLSLSFNCSSSTNNSLTNSSVTQTGRLGYHSISGTIITILTKFNLNAQKMCCLFAFWYHQNTEWNPTTVVLAFLCA